MRELFARLLDWTCRDRLDRELREELEFHRQQLVREVGGTNDAQGREDAHYAARRRLGNLTGIREAARERWSVPFVEHVSQDLRYAFRGLRRSPVFTLTIVVTLALGLGVNAAVLSLVDRLFNTLPAGVFRAESLRRVYVDGETRVRDQFNYPEWQDLSRAAESTPMTTYAADSTRIGASGNESFVGATYTDAAYWSVLGVHPILGRSFGVDEARIEVPVRVVIISHSLWRRRFNARPDIIGQSMQVNGNRFDIIGVTPKSFQGTEVSASDVWIPLGSMPMMEFGKGRTWYQIRSDTRLKAVLRMSPSAASGNLEARLSQAYRIGSVAAGYQGDTIARIMLGSIISARGPVKAGPELMITKRLAWVSALVLLIACANVANLLLTRLIERRREIAVRLALGVSRSRLATQFVMETLVLTSISAAGALVVGSSTGKFLRTLVLPGTYWQGDVLERQHLTLLAGAALLTALMIALVPILHVRKFGNNDVFRSGQRATSASGNRMRNMLIVSQTSLAVVLLTGAALCVESLRRVMAVDVGVDTHSLAIARPTILGARGAEDPERANDIGMGLTAAGERIAAIPGVEAVAFALHAPMHGYISQVVSVPGIDTMLFRHEGLPAVHNVSPQYWHASGIRLIRGRLFAATDGEGMPPVVVINETMASKVWPGRDPIGQCVILARDEAPCRTIVGIVPDTHRRRILEPSVMQLYVPLAQASRTGRGRAPSAIIVRASPDRMPLVLQATRRELTAALPTAVLRLSTLQDALKPQFHQWRLGATLFTALAGLGLLVAAIGLYGVISYSVRQRLHEIGIRMALGAERRRIVVGVLRQGVLNVLAGFAGGAVLAVILSRFMSALLYDTSLRNPAILAGVGAAMLVTAIAASILPAWTAAGVDPVSALREES